MNIKQIQDPLTFTPPEIRKAADSLFHRDLNDIRSYVDRWFIPVLALEWITAIGSALFISPLTWAGTSSSLHIHLWTSILLGGIIFSLPAYLTFAHKGHVLTRHVIAIAQMLMAGIFIQLTGGRIETHFMIFGSLAFLSFYRDWKVLVTASIVVVLDHLLRTAYWPLSIYGIPDPSQWRTLEHAGWVVFEDFFLIALCIRSLSEMRAIAAREAILSSDHAKLLELTGAIGAVLTRGATLKDVLQGCAEALVNHLNAAFARIWTLNESENMLELQASAGMYSHIDGPHGRVPVGKFKIGLIAQEQKPHLTNSVIEDPLVGDKEWAQREGMVAFAGHPLLVDGRLVGVMALFSKSVMGDDTLTALSSIADGVAACIQRKQSELKASRLATIVETSDDAIYSKDLSGRITSWNRGAEVLFGYTPEEAIGQSILMLVPEDCLEEYNHIYEAVQRGERVSHYDTVRLKKSGDPVDVSNTFSPILTADGSVIGVSVIARDITERKEVERRMTEFYSMISHELRSPLASVRGALGLISGGRAGEISEKTKHLVTIASSSTDRLIRLINDILDVRKMEAGKLELRLEETEIEKIIETSIDGMRGLAQEANVTIVQKESLPLNVNADTDKLVQVMTNLLSNAIKFSPEESEVIVNCELVESQNLRLSVSDHGPGIPENQKHMLFSKFQQLDSSDRRPKEGTGLGLVISKAIVEAHGGKIGFDSKAGKGSTFWFEMPCVARREVVAASSKTQTPTAAVPKVLLVDDDENLSGVIDLLVSGEGYELLRAGNIAEARSILANQKPAAVILDLHLPDGSGLDFLTALKADSRLSELPVIMLTGSEKGDASFAEPMFIDWVTKPFDQNRLLKSLHRAIRIPGSARVLIVEDDPLVREVIAAQLAEMGVNPIQAADGEQAVSLAHENKPDLIILDVAVPILDGFGVVSKLRESFQRTPLLVYTGRDLEDEDRQKLTLGLTKHLTKARSSRKEFLDAVRQLLNGLLPKDDDKS